MATAPTAAPPDALGGALDPLASAPSTHKDLLPASRMNRRSTDRGAHAPAVVGAPWLHVAAMLYGTAEGFAARKRASEVRRHAASSITMAYRRHVLSARCTLRLVSRQQRSAATIQWYWRHRAEPRAFIKAFTKAQKVELIALLDARIARRRVGEKRRGALFSALREYGAYEAALVKLQVAARILIGRKLLKKLHRARNEFRRKLSDQGAQLSAVAIRWQRQVRRWRQVRGLAWAEYARASHHTTLAHVRRCARACPLPAPPPRWRYHRARARCARARAHLRRRALSGAGR